MTEDDRVRALREEIRTRLLRVKGDMSNDLFDSLVEKLLDQELKPRRIETWPPIPDSILPPQ